MTEVKKYVIRSHNRKIGAEVFLTVDYKWTEKLHEAWFLGSEPNDLVQVFRVYDKIRDEKHPNLTTISLQEVFIESHSIASRDLDALRRQKVLHSLGADDRRVILEPQPEVLDPPAG